MPIWTFNNTLKGKHVPPRFRVYAEEWGVPFTKVFRSRKAAEALKNKEGVSRFTLVTLN